MNTGIGDTTVTDFRIALGFLQEFVDSTPTDGAPSHWSAGAYCKYCQVDVVKNFLATHKTGCLIVKARALLARNPEKPETPCETCGAFPRKGSCPIKCDDY